MYDRFEILKEKEYPFNLKIKVEYAIEFSKENVIQVDIRTKHLN